MNFIVRKRIERGLIGGGVAVTVLTFLNPIEMLGDVYYVWLIPVLLFLIIACTRKFEIFGIFRQAKKSYYIAGGILTALYLIMSPISSVFQLPCFIFSRKTAFECFLVPFNWLFFLMAPAALLACILFGFEIADREKESREISAKRTLLFCSLIIGCISVAYAFAGYPGILHDDGVGIWNRFSDWHPFGYILITRFCFLIWANPFSIVIFQTILWIATNIFILYTLINYKNPKAAILYTVLSLTTGIMAYKYIPVVYKDVIFSMCFLGFGVSLYRLLNKISTSNFIFTAIYGVFSSITRHGAIVAVLVALAGVGILYLLRRNSKLAVKFLAICAIPVVIVSGSIKIGINIAGIEKSPSYVTYTVPLFMLGAYAASGLEMSEDTVATMEKIMPLEDWEKGYESDKYWADTVSRTWGIVGDRIEEFEKQHLQGEVIKANWEFFSRYPLSYAKYFFDINSLVWEMSRPDGTYAEWLVNSFDNCSDRAENEYPQWYPAEHNVFRKILEPVTAVAFEVPLWRIFTYRGGINIWMLAYASVVVGRKDKKLLLVVLPFFLYAAMLMFSLPAQDPRFILPFVEFATFFMPVAFLQDMKTTKILPKIADIQEEKSDGQNSDFDSVLQ